MSTAVLDIGTNTLRVLIKNEDKEIFRKNYYLFLGNDVVDGKLTFQAVKKLEKTLSEISLIFLENEVNDFFGIATAFARKLRFEKELKDIFFRHFGKEIKIIDGNEEGKLVSEGIKNQFNIDTFSVIDIGGGSSEITLRDRNNIVVKSLEIGSLFLQKQFFQNFPPTSEEKNQFCHYVMKKFEEELEKKLFNPVFAVGGTATTLAFILSGEKVYAKELINGFQMNIKDLERLYHSIEYLKLERIKELYPIEEGREKVLLSGLLLVLLFMNYFSLDEIIASDTSLLEGLYYQFYKKSASST